MHVGLYALFGRLCILRSHVVSIINTRVFVVKLLKCTNYIVNRNYSTAISFNFTNLSIYLLCGPPSRRPL